MPIDELIDVFFMLVGLTTIFHFSMKLIFIIIDKMTRRKEDDKEPGKKTE